MPTFLYMARGADNKVIKGKLSAATKEAAAGQLSRQNLNVVSLREKKGSFLGIGAEPSPKVTTKDISVLTRQLATMISAGIPLLEALEILEEQAEDKGFKLALGRIIDKVRAGTDLSEAISDYPKIFTRIYVNMVKAGEAGGQLDGILNRLSEYMEAAEELKREIKSAMTYPVISLCLIFAIVAGLMVGIVPKFKEIFLTLNVELPPPTKFLLWASDFLVNEAAIWVSALVVTIVGFIVWKKTDTGARQWDWLMLRVPIFGPLFRKVAISRFARTFATLIQSGVPILGALEIVAATAGNRIVEEAVLKARESVRQGNTLGEPLGKGNVFPPMVTRMIAIGERAGALETLLVKISEFYDGEVKATVAALTSLIEPLLIMVMGLVVGGIVLAIFLPILKIQEAVQKK